MTKFCYGCTLCGCIIGGLLLLGAVVDDSAVREAAYAALGVGFAVVPYCFARACEGLKKD